MSSPWKNILKILNSFLVTKKWNLTLQATNFLCQKPACRNGVHSFPTVIFTQRMLCFLRLCFELKEVRQQSPPDRTDLLALSIAKYLKSLNCQHWRSRGVLSILCLKGAGFLFPQKGVEWQLLELVGCFFFFPENHFCYHLQLCLYFISENSGADDRVFLLQFVLNLTLQFPDQIKRKKNKKKKPIDSL